MASGYFIGSGDSGGVVWGELNGRKVLSISEMEMAWKTWCFGSSVNGLKRGAWGKEWQWLLSFWDSALWLLCVALSAHHNPPLGCSPNALPRVSMQGQWRVDSAQPDGFHWAVGPSQFELLQWLLALWSRASGVQGKLPPDSHSGQGEAENMSQGICLKSYLKQQATGQGAVGSLIAREQTQLVGGWKWWSG